MPLNWFSAHVASAHVVSAHIVDASSMRLLALRESDNTCPEACWSSKLLGATASAAERPSFILWVVSTSIRLDAWDDELSLLAITAAELRGVTGLRSSEEVTILVLLNTAGWPADRQGPHQRNTSFIWWLPSIVVEVTASNEIRSKG